eukprot:GHRQ01012935.1.p1 GENE.GHRQ01012935.1~~GHRQ01012935.1.p1  ORF type:complete len:140 (+),score=37.88 GHRQ01012935.1:398-817(+)
MHAHTHDARRQVCPADSDSVNYCCCCNGCSLVDVIGAGQGFVESAADLVPANVPRPLAKGGVAVATGLVAFWVLQKLVFTVLTIALLGGAAWFYFQYSGGSGSSGGGSSGGGSSSRRADDGDFDDPLSEARRIMDKYKK